MILIFSLALLIGIGLATSAATAGENAGENAKGSVFGEVRWRYEGWNNYFDLNSNTKDKFSVNWLRSRVGYKTKIGNRAFAKIAVDNLRVFGGDAEVAPLFRGSTDPDKGVLFNEDSNDAIELDTAILGLEDFIFKKFTVWAGRAKYDLGYQRILGVNDWSMPYEHRFDGFGGYYLGDEWWLKLLCLTIAETGLARYSEDGDYLGDTWLRGAYAHWDATETFWLEPYLLWVTTAGGQDANDTITDAFKLGNSSVWEFGALFDFVAEYGLHLYAEGVYQVGDARTREGDVRPYTDQKTDISALGFYTGLFYTFDTKIQPYLGVEYDYATGTSQDEFDKNEEKTFVSPFGSWSDYLGRANIIDWSNTASWRFAAGLTATKGLTVEIDVWLFNLAEAQDYAYNPISGPISGERDDAGNFDKAVGTEFDILAEYEMDHIISFEGGLTYFNPGKYFGEATSENPMDAVVMGYLGAMVSF
jgi:hypothetical protein